MRSRHENSVDAGCKAAFAPADPLDGWALDANSRPANACGLPHRQLWRLLLASAEMDSAAGQSGCRRQGLARKKRSHRKCRAGVPRKRKCSRRCSRRVGVRVAVEVPPTSSGTGWLLTAPPWKSRPRGTHMPLLAKRTCVPPQLASVSCAELLVRGHSAGRRQPWR
jgi:hypothetical protein